MLQTVVDAYVSGLTEFWSNALTIRIPKLLLVLLLFWWLCRRRGCGRHRRGCCDTARCACTCGACCCGGKHGEGSADGHHRGDGDDPEVPA